MTRLAAALPEPELRAWIADTRALLDRIESSLAPANDTGRETLDEWFERWDAYRLRAGHVSERGKYERWIAPRLGGFPVSALSPQDIDHWVEWIEGQVTDRALRETTANRVWTALCSMMRDAHGSRNRELRVRLDNPLKSVRAPSRGTVRVGTFLYPSEFLRLANCRRIPLDERRIYAVAVYLYARAGELVALRWSDIDLKTGRIHIHRALKARTGKLVDRVEGATKTGCHRQFVVERQLLPLLRAMRRASKGDKVIPELPHNPALTLRSRLRSAGCERDDLFASDEHRRPITFHDLRATGITWQAMRGDSPTAILERVGHKHLATTEQYLRRGRLMALARGERVFPPLPDCLLGKRKK